MNKPNIQGSVAPKSKGQSLKDDFIAEDFKEVKNYIYHEKIIPAIKQMIISGFTSGLEMMLTGKKTTPTTTGWGGWGSSVKPSYWKPSQPTTAVQPAYSSRSYNYVLVPTLSDAEDTINWLHEIISEYGKCTIADLYEAVKIPVESSDYNYGWFNTIGFDPKETPDGWVIVTPRPIPVK